MSVFHTYSEYEPKDAYTKQRHEVAKTTWSTQLWTGIPVRDSDLPRVWSEEGRTLPYLHDLFDFACNLSGDDPVNQVIVYTNADICVCSDCAIKVASIMQDTDAFFSYRRDFNHDFKEPIPDEMIPKGDGYCGSDFYAFRVRWWNKHKSDFPDMLIGCELWDAILRHMIEFTNAGKPVFVPNLSYHRKHAGMWEQPANRYRLKCQIHNLRLGSAWLRSKGIHPSIHGVPKRVGNYTL